MVKFQEKLENNKKSDGVLNSLIKNEQNKVKRLFTEKQLAIVFSVGFLRCSAVKIGENMGYSNRTIEDLKNRIADIILENYDEFLNCNYKPTKLIREFWRLYEHPIRYTLFKGFGADLYNNYGEFIEYLLLKNFVKLIDV